MRRPSSSCYRSPVTFNPYAPPENHAEPAPSTGGSGLPQDWTVEEVLSGGWAATKQHWPALVLGPVIGGIVASLPGQVIQFASGGAPNPFALEGSFAQKQSISLQVATTVIGMCAQAFFQGGMIKLSLQAARGGSPSLTEMFSGGPVYLRLLGANFLMMLVIMLGTVALIIPGIILGLGLAMTPYYVVDAGMGPVEAMQASWKAMVGHKGSLFGFLMMGILVSLLGLLACCVGVLVSYAVMQTAMAIIFTRVSGRTGSRDDQSQSPYAPQGFGREGGPTPPPGGGWGAA